MGKALPSSLALRHDERQNFLALPPCSQHRWGRKCLLAAGLASVDCIFPYYFGEGPPAACGESKWKALLFEIDLVPFRTTVSAFPSNISRQTITPP